jgi:hypothetical protein
MPRIARLLLVFTFINMECESTQGFHELGSLLYYVACTAATALETSGNNTECIAFFLLLNLIIETDLCPLLGIQEPDRLKDQLRRE